jgi:hypothetical protein
VAELGGWVAKFVARIRLSRQHSGLESRYPSKIIKGRHAVSKGVLLPGKKNTKIN